MHPDAMTPYGLAIQACHHGDKEAELLIHRDDGREDRLPVSFFFRPPSEFSAIETTAIDQCCGHVLDIGGGTGVHTLELEARGIRVTAIDASPYAVTVMQSRGAKDVRQVDVFDHRAAPYDTLLLLGHGIGMVEDMAGLVRFLMHARTLTRPDGQLLIHSVDVRRTDDPAHLAYHDANRRAGRYVGAIRFRFIFREHAGPFFTWLQVDPQTLQREAQAVGWGFSMLHEVESGDYLARLTSVVTT